MDSRVPHDLVRFNGTNVTAILGPTNTGKTFYAIERMVAHSSGVIGLPLRLLAREVYQKVVDRVGISQVSLITGEEKIRPPHARFHVCTVEAMPRRTDAAFVAIDEVQLAADLERGHVFTDRILNTRGREETLLLGASTMRGVLERLLRGVSTVTRPRMSQLLYAGSKKTTRLPRRSAIVAFSADEVYAIAELVRRQRGGAAVVMGALSPRTRNAQVELYQSGDVDFLVATDAIGMGLNLDVDHVAFAQDWKFDGFQYRQLTPAELGQIAGRAGRHVRDGTFGVTGQVDPFADELVEMLESHAFSPVRVLQWRTDQLDFSSLASLRTSLDTLPPVPELTRSLPSVDQRALELLSRDHAVSDRAQDAARVELLWEACKLPDYRRIAPAQHAEIIATVYQDLVANGQISEDYMAVEVRRADRPEGDIDTLSRRIAEIRTWTYISHRPGWLADPTHWQEKTRDIEDRLSDALHDRLTKRFVDRRTSVLMKRLRENAFMEAEIGVDGKVLVEGHHVGELQGFRFTPDTKADGPDAKAVRTAAQKALAGEFETRAERFSNAPNGDIALGSDGLLRWLGAPVASLSSGEDALKPRVVILADEHMSQIARDKIAARAERYVTYQISTILKPLVDLKTAEGIEGTAKGIAYRLCEHFGLIQRREVSDDIRSLDQDARAALRRFGVRFGAYHIFVPALVKPAPANLLTLLWGVQNDGRDRPGFGDVTHLLQTGRTSAVADATFDPVFYKLAGYRLLGRRAVRVDILERLADLIRPALSWKPGTGKRPDGGYNGAQFLVTPAMMSILGATADDMEEILKGLGYRGQAVEQRQVEETVTRLDSEAATAAAAKAAEATTPAVPTPGEGVTDGGAGPEFETSADGVAEASDVESQPVALAEGAILEAGLVDAAELQAEGEVAPPSQAETDEGPASIPADATPSELPHAEDVLMVEAADSEPVQVAISADALPAPPAEAPKMVLVWRPQRQDGRGAREERGASRRPHGRGRGAPAPQSVAAEPVASGETAAVAAPEGERHRGPRQPPRGGGEAGERPSRFGKGGDRQDRQAQREPRFSGNGSHPAAAQSDAPVANRSGGPGGSRNERSDERNRGRADGDRGKEASLRNLPDNSRPRFEKPQPRIDPDSPFAKLAALRDKLGK